jgi:hypothetical protein
LTNLEIFASPINAFTESALPFIKDQNKFLKRNLIENGVHFYHHFVWTRKCGVLQLSLQLSKRPEIVECEILVVGWMKESYDSEVIEISQCLMGSGIIEIKESISGTLRQPVLCLLFIQIGQDFLTKNSRLNVSCNGRMAALSIPERKKQTQIITFFVPINGRTRIGLAIYKPAYMEDRGLS